MRLHVTTTYLGHFDPLHVMQVSPPRISCRMKSQNLLLVCNIGHDVQSCQTPCEVKWHVGQRQCCEFQHGPQRWYPSTPRIPDLGVEGLLQLAGSKPAATASPAPHDWFATAPSARQITVTKARAEVHLSLTPLQHANSAGQAAPQN